MKAIGKSYSNLKPEGKEEVLIKAPENGSFVVIWDKNDYLLEKNK